MKQKKIFILAAAALAFAACSSDESPTAPEEQQTGAAYTQGEVPVAFDAYMNRATTRAGWAGDLGVTDKIQDAAVGGFGVFAYYTDNKPYSETSLPNFMYNQQVTYESGWKYAPIKYWPNEFGINAESEGEDRLTFFAYAPYVKVDPKTGRLTNESVGSTTTGIVGMTSNTTTGNPYVKYCVDFVPANCVDLCWGVAGSELKAAQTVTATPQNNIEVGSAFVDVIKPTTDDKIKFDFKHALAALNVQIDADVDIAPNTATHTDKTLDKRTRIWVRSVTFEGFTDKGALNLYSEGTPQWFELSCINNAIGSTTVTVYDGRRDGKEGVAPASNEKYLINKALTQGGVYTKANATDGLEINSTYVGVTNELANLFQSDVATDPIYVIPSTDKLKITIVYDVETWDDNVAGYLSDGNIKGSSIENRITNKTAIFADPMEAGKTYTVKLHLGMTSVKFDAAVSPWTAGGTQAVDLPQNTVTPTP
jgi:hypothetical protein